MQPDRSLTGRHVFVAGATSGMGRATALAASKEGAAVVLLGRDSDRLDTVAAQALDAGATAVTQIRADVSDAETLDKALIDHQDTLSQVDTLINTVGVNLVKRAFVELTAASWASMIDTNLNAAFNLSRLIIPHFRNRGGGLLINVSSTAARKPDPSGAAYQATKAGVMAMTHAIQEEEWQNGIRATAILPGMTDTPLLEKRPTPPTADMRAKALQPEDVAQACLFVMGLPARAHVSELMIQPAQR